MLLMASMLATADATNPQPNVHTTRQLATRHRVPMNGACAVIARSNVWSHETKELKMDPDTGELEPIGKVVDSKPMWDYRIKVDPWCAHH